MDLLVFSFVVVALFVAVSCMSDWLISALDPYASATEAGSFKAADRVGLQPPRAKLLARTPLRIKAGRSAVRGLNRYDVQIRDLPFIC